MSAATTPAADTSGRPSRGAMFAAFAVIYIVWGSTYLGIKVAVDTMPPFAMAATRFALAGAVLIFWLRLRGYAWPTARQWRDAAFVGPMLLLGGNGLVAWAELYIPSGLTALVIGIGPLFMVLTEWAWPGGTRPTARTFFALALGVAGVAWLATPNHDSALETSLHLPALFAILVGCLTWSIGSIYSRHTTSPAPPFMGAAQQMLCGSAALALTAIFTGDWTRLDVAAISPASWTAFAYLVTIGSLLAFSTYVWLLKHSTPARISTHTWVNPIVAVFLGWAILSEPITARTLAAAALIVVAVLLVTLQKNRRA
jgi:drug/metabolite transporter (DMT)-like permease